MTRQNSGADFSGFAGKAASIPDFREKYEDYLRFLDGVFFSTDPSTTFRRILSKIYSDAEYVRVNTFAAMTEGAFVGAVGSFPFRLDAPDTVLKGRIIGNVAVRPDHRLQGIMKLLMDMAMDDACAEGLDLMALGGARQRYQYYSFESAGPVLSFTVTPANLRHCFGKDAHPSIRLEEIRRTDEDILARIGEMHACSPYHADRPADRLFDILTSWKSRPCAAWSGDQPAGYVVFNEDRTKVLEWDAVSPSLFNDLVHAAAADAGEKAVSFELPAYETEKIRILSGLCESVSMTSCCQFTVLNYRNVLAALMRLRASAAPLCEGRAVVEIHGRAGVENLEIRVSGGSVSVEESRQPPELVMTHLEAMALFFAPVCAARTALAPEIASWLPLPLYLPPLDNA